MMIKQLLICMICGAHWSCAFLNSRSSLGNVVRTKRVNGDGVSLQEVKSQPRHGLWQTYAVTKSKNTEGLFNSSSASFASLGLSYDLQKAAYRNNWTSPSEVQRKAIPAILDGERHLCIEAQTGSGKTASYILPLVQMILQDKRKDVSVYGKSRKCVRSLILAPTRELCVQISEVLDAVCKASGENNKIDCSSTAIYGGVPIEPQMEVFYSLFMENNDDKFPDIIVATPGRLVDILNRFDDDPNDLVLERKLIDALDKKNKSGRDDATVRQKQIKDEKLDRGIDESGELKLGKSLLRSISTLVLDEADRLCSPSFQEEVDAVFDLVQTTRKEEDYLRKLLVSATFPKSIQPRLNNLLQASKPKNDGSNTGDDSLLCITCEENGMSDIQGTVLPSTIIQRVINVEEESRTQALRYLIENSDPQEWNKVLCFVATRYQSEIVSKKLRRVGISALELHGKLDQESRTNRLRKFKSGKTQVLIATDLASRGLDIKGLPVVINYDLPRSPADFTHRIGRTGRAGMSGVAVSFVSPSNESHFNLIERKILKAKMFRETLPGLEPDEEKWVNQKAEYEQSLPGVQHSSEGLAHDKMYGGIKGKRKSKKDKLREAAAAAPAITAPYSEESLYQ